MQQSASVRCTMIARISSTLLVTVWLGLGPLAAVADNAPDLLEEPFNIALGSFIVNTDTKVRLDGTAGQGTLVDLDRTFGGGDVTRFRIDGYWRFAERHKVRALWFSSSRTRSKELTEEIEWGDEVFPINARVDGKLGFDIYELAYEYAFLQRDNYELSGTIGLHYAEFSTRLSAKASASGGTLTADIDETAKVGAPLPVIGIRGMWGLPYDFWIDASAQYFALSIDEYDGSVQDYRVAAVWQPKTWLGIGLGYNHFSVDVDVDKKRFDGKLDWTYSGPMLFYSAAF